MSNLIADCKLYISTRMPIDKVGNIMNYIERITPDEKNTLCEIITGRDFKELFKLNEKEFAKIQKGFRAKTLTDKFALKIAINSIDKPFISSFVNVMVDTWLKEIQNSIENLEKGGSTHDDALADTLLGSYFSNDVDLYLKLSGKSLDEKALAKLYKRMGSIKSERMKNAEFDERIKDMEEEKTRLLDQIKSTQQSANTIKAEYEQKIQEVEQKNESLELALAQTQSKITELQTATDNKADDISYLLQYDDTNNSALPSSNSNEIVSLCVTTSDYNGQKWLIRYADLNNKGHYHVFRKIEEISPYFSNRDRIYFRNGPSDDGFYGVWNWTAIPNENDPSKDYIQSQYNTSLDAIEVVIISGASNLDNLISQIKSGITYQVHSRRVMFAYTVSKEQYTGVICNTKDLKTVNGKTTFDENCIEVPVYQFNESDILYLNNRLSFFRNAFAGIPSEIYRLVNPIDIVKKIVLSSISWTAYKKSGATHAEYRDFKDFISAIPTDNITHKIEVACHCSNSSAKDLLSQFLNMICKYVDGDSLEDEIILSAISKHSELQERTQELLRVEWEVKNHKMIAEAQKDLDLIYTKLKSAHISLAEVQETITQTQSEEERLDRIISEKEKLAVNVETAVAAKIQKARENAADFIANMAFVAGHSPWASDKNAITAKYQIIPEYTDIQNLEANHSWDDVINTAVIELGEAGVAEKYRCGLASFLCAAYIEKQPIFLIGPNALDIVQAFSAATTGQKYGVLCCDGCYSNQTITEIGANGEKIVVINNLLASGWINRLPEFLSKKDIFFVATHPFAEDVQVEPKSLYGQMLPLFTEFFVNNKATGNYYGGYFAEDFKSYTAPNGTQKGSKALSSLELSPLVRNRISRIVTTMHDLYDKTTGDDEFLFAVLPIAYASLQISEIAEAVGDQHQGITISANLRRDLKHILGDS